MSKITSPFSKEQLMPQAEMLEIERKKGKLFIGVPKETYTQEYKENIVKEGYKVICSYASSLDIK